ncbi:MAG: hypothetical protein ABI175_01710, partial [Polyangiales bacterium]
MFFAEMGELLAGRKTAAQCEAVLGPSPSGTMRLAVYAKLVDRQQRGALASLFRAALVAADSWDPRRSEELRAGYLSTFPPAHWAPSVVAAPFADYLIANGAPADVIELADFARTRFEVLRAPASDGIDGLAVRHYTHAIHTFTHQVERAGLTSGRPTSEATTLILGRHRETADFVVITPTLAMMVALQLAEERSWSPELPTVERCDVRDAAAALFAHGLLSEVALANIRLVAKLRISMRARIKRLQYELGTTMVYVTHDQIEAMTLATRVVVM